MKSREIRGSYYSILRSFFRSCIDDTVESGDALIIVTPSN